MFLQLPPVVSIDIPEDIRYGPFVDTVVYEHIIGSGIILALQIGRVDIGDISYYSDASYFDDFENIDVLECPSNWYHSITINCDQYPLNINGFRRAFAFAFNKSKAVEHIYEGHASLHDSIVPSAYRWCAEDLLEYHYYEADIERGNAILDELGFTLNTTTGFRDAPNGEPFIVSGYYFEYSPEIMLLASEALDSLNINNDMDPLWTYPPPSSYGMVHSYSNFEYDTNMVWEDDLSNYRNASLSYWIDKYHEGKTYEEVFEASVQIQKNLHHNVPRLVVCQPHHLEGIRTDQFQGHVEDTYRYFSGPWTLRRIHQIDGTYGGTLWIACDWVDSFNIYTTWLRWSKEILDNLYSSLYSLDPNMNPISDLAESLLVETHSDNPSVPRNHTRFTFDIIQNATWSDGVPLTAEDIAFTFLYQLESLVYGNPAASSLTDIVAVYTPSPYRVVFEFSSESYWNFDKIAYEYIIPKHIFTTIGYEGWDTWNPVFDSEQPHVTSGPFVLTDFDYSEETYELTFNPRYHWLPSRPLLEPNITTTTTPISQDPTLLFFSVGAYSVIAVGVIVLLIKDRKQPE
jgi:ABC-type transport system substrate-binding protein